jgi:hypothetical protein
VLKKSIKKLLLVPIILGFAAIALAGQADARPGGAWGVQLSGKLLATFVGHGGRRWLCIWNTPAEQL